MSQRFMRALSEFLDDHVDVWHELPSDDPDSSLPLSEYLGMTWDQYAQWTQTGIPPWGALEAAKHRGSNGPR